MQGLNTALSALRTSQTAMDVIANNIANANTPGYHRQSAHEVSTSPVFLNNHWMGTGVDISNINQIASRAVESALTTNISDLNRVGQSLQIARGIEGQLAPSFGSLQERFQQFFDEVQQLQTAPDDTTQRRILVEKSSSLAAEFRTLDAGLVQMQAANQQDIQIEVQQLNQKLAELTSLNKQISLAQSRNDRPNSLLDAHQQLVNDIAKSIDINVIMEETGFRYQFANNRVSTDSTPFQVEVSFQADGSAVFTRPNSDRPLEFTGGRLAGIQQAQNSLIPGFRQDLDDLASSFIRTVNQIQATGVALDGGSTFLRTSSPVPDPTAPLADADLPFEIEAGRLFVSIQDQATGTRTQHSIEIDPAVDSLQDVRAAISDLPNVQALIDTESGNFSIVAEPGFTFDFSSQLPTEPDRTNVTGDAQITFSGFPENTDNRQLNFAIAGSGTVGVADDLQLVVTDKDGQFLASHNLGEGYEVGKPIDLGQGTLIEFDTGTLNDGDQFSVESVANTDAGGFLSAIGINPFFTGSSASDIQVADAIRQDPGRIAASQSGNVGDASNLTRMLDQRERPLVDSQYSFEGQVSKMTSAIAIEVSGLTFLQSDLTALQNSLVQERESISGVDPNEEMVRMLQYQRSFQAAARVITTIDQTLNELMNIIR